MGNQQIHVVKRNDILNCNELTYYQETNLQLTHIIAINIGFKLL